MTKHEPPDPWHDAGFDDHLAAHCACTGWTLADVTTVLCTDVTSDAPIDWCFSGLDPLEVHAAIQDGVAAPPLRQHGARASTRIGERDARRLPEEVAHGREREHEAGTSLLGRLP